VTAPDDGAAAVAALAGQVRKSLHWAVFLTAAAILITVIDMQLKRGIARQAIAVSRMLADTTMMAVKTDQLIAAIRQGDTDGQSGAVDAPGDGGHHPGRGSRGDVGGSPGVPAGTSPEGSPAPPVAHRRGRGTVKRAPGDG
jgi:hypothetical protein